MPSVEFVSVLVLAPVAGVAAWLAVRRARRGRLSALAAAVSAALMVAALAGIFVGEGSALRVFVIDVSASAGTRLPDVLAQVRGAGARLARADRVAVVVFGRDAAVLLPPTPAAELPAAFPTQARVDQDGTCIEAGVAAALELFAAGAAGDIVLLTDGRETSGDATAAAARAAARGIPIHTLTLPAPARTDAWVESVRAPASASIGADRSTEIDFEVLVGASAPTHGKLVLLANGREMSRPEPIDIVSTPTVLARRLAVREPGLYVLTARLQCEGDGVSQNDAGSAAVRVRGAPTVTYVTGPGDRALADALRSSGAFVLRRTGPEALDTTNAAMLESDVIVLDNVSAKALDGGRIAWLHRFVADAGRGLVVMGGRDAFGPGGYAGTELAGLLPVDPDPKRRAAKPASVVIVADRSGSMNERVGGEGGQKKIELVRAALLRAGAEFGSARRGDELSVVAFNEAPEVFLERARVGTPDGSAALRRAVGRVFAAGQTRIGPALDAALELIGASPLKRHVILVSDGRGQDTLDGVAVAAKLKGAGAVLSVLATGSEMNPGLRALKAAADATGGRFVMLRSLAQLPRAMERETRTIAGSLVREGAAPVERGPGAWHVALAVPPPVTGYVLTAARPGAPPLLVTGEAPLLARWRRGLGRVVACTTSLDDWAGAWKPAAAALFVPLVRWAAAGDRPREVSVALEPDDDRIGVRVEFHKPPGRRRPAGVLLAPTGGVSALELRQVGARRFEASAPAPATGTYIARVSDAGTGDLLGEGHATIGYGAEWKPGGDRSLPGRMSQMTSGAVLESVQDVPAPTRSRSGAPARRNLATILFCAAAAAFVLSSLR